MAFRPTSARFLELTRGLLHENPLGLPRSGTPPTWGKRPQKRKINGVDKVIAVSSAKGGVGKSTIADNQLVPLTNYGVKTMSMGYLVGENAPVVWRGPMVMKAVQQLLHEVDWGGLDMLVLDLPPGTGDTQLTITQQVILDGAVIVTTPHTLATKDAVKGINMFKTVDVDILGLVHNMSLFKCPHCNGETHVFGSNERVERMCNDHRIDFLGDIPLHPNIGDDGERGKPTVVAEPTSERASAFLNIAGDVMAKVGLKTG
ncbi:Iron-sulfur protein IND1 [Emericellopsis cladophorae]|uniref:Iron-sulfur protein IND1 n=1 Tax=Emericellopsis cladophorae TaxID=2686198 RepID=A0A9P9Y0D0_9HYPO|nr:Iron-sulfur protein IND1 [Emericellopsis cladophorae]KAI6780976.1 Iron-sulfur protein IND1 [Emericellopsis cladophorae]